MAVSAGMISDPREDSGGTWCQRADGNAPGDWHSIVNADCRGLPEDTHQGRSFFSSPAETQEPSVAFSRKERFMKHVHCSADRLFPAAERMAILLASLPKCERCAARMELVARASPLHQARTMLLRVMKPTPTIESVSCRAF